jgi:hypothetical protein
LPLQNPETHKITDFFSIYYLPSTILHNAKHGTLDAGYLYYYATDVAFEDGADDDGRLKDRLQTLIGDALVIANQAKLDVFNALTWMDNVPILKDLKVCKDINASLRTHAIAVRRWGRVPERLFVQLEDGETCRNGGCRGCESRAGCWARHAVNPMSSPTSCGTPNRKVIRSDNGERIALLVRSYQLFFRHQRNSAIRIQEVLVG